MLHELEVRDFRCFAHAKLPLHPQTTVLLGRNAQGKTSLLEAACVLLRLQSPRTSNRSDMIRLDSKSFVVEGRRHEGRLRFGASQTVRRMAVDNAIITNSADYLKHSGLVVWMDHSDMNLVRGTAEHRRRFLDFAASQIEPDYLHALQAYNRALRSRNYVLKREDQINWRQADAYARLMAGFHQVIVAQRHQLLQAVEPRAQEVLGSLSGGSETMQVHYAASCAPQMLFDLLLANREEEQRTRTTFAGAHRDDFTVLINKQPADVFASEGQQRSLSLALKLAQTRVLEQARGEPPLLLIDDVFGELDPLRRRALLELLPHDSQRIITTTHMEWAGGLQDTMSVWNVEGAALSLA